MAAHNSALAHTHTHTQNKTKSALAHTHKAHTKHTQSTHKAHTHIYTHIKHKHTHKTPLSRNCWCIIGGGGGEPWLRTRMFPKHLHRFSSAISKSTGKMWKSLHCCFEMLFLVMQPDTPCYPLPPLRPRSITWSFWVKIKGSAKFTCTLMVTYKNFQIFGFPQNRLTLSFTEA